MCERLEDERNDEQGPLCMCGDEGQEAALSQIWLRRTEAVTTLGPGQEERKERNLLARSGLLKISQQGFVLFSLKPSFSALCFVSSSLSYPDSTFKCVSSSWARGHPGHCL